MRINARVREPFRRDVRAAPSPARRRRATGAAAIAGSSAGVTTIEYLLVLSLVALGLVGALRLLRSGAQQAADSQTRVLAAWIADGKSGASVPRGALPEPPREEPASGPPAPPDEGGGFGGFLAGAADFAIEMSPIGDIKTLFDPNASTFDKVLAGVGLVSSVIPGAGQAVKGATVAIKAGKAANKASDAVDDVRDGQRASDEVDEGADAAGRGKRGDGGSGGGGGSGGDGRNANDEPPEEDPDEVARRQQEEEAWAQHDAPDYERPPPERDEPSGRIRQTYDDIQDAPNYPDGFETRSVRREDMTDRELYAELQNVEPGKWVKVYRDGVDATGKRISLHYFESPSGRVFSVKPRDGWTNSR